jgi:S1-C subfamily serine protease
MVVFEEHRRLSRVRLVREISDFDRLFATVAVAPAQGGGFVIVRLEPRSFVASLGVRQGDVVRSVAGEQVSTIEAAARVYARLVSLPSFSVEVERGSQRIVVHYDVK